MCHNNVPFLNGCSQAREERRPCAGIARFTFIRSEETPISAWRSAKPPCRLFSLGAPHDFARFPYHPHTGTAAPRYARISGFLCPIPCRSGRLRLQLGQESAVITPSRAACTRPAPATRRCTAISGTPRATPRRNHQPHPHLTQLPAQTALSPTTRITPVPATRRCTRIPDFPQPTSHRSRHMHPQPTQPDQ